MSVSVLKHRSLSRRVAAGSTAAVTIAALSWGGVALAAAPTTNVLIKGIGSGRCLTPPPDSTANATIQNCAGQHWSTGADGTITGNGQCLDAKGEATANGTVVTVFACHGGANQKWTVGSDGTIRGLQSGRCLDVNGEATAAGSKVQLWDCHGGNNQKWQLVADGGGDPPAGDETVGGGTIASPAVGPGPSSSVFGSNFTLVKNWNFGSGGTVKNIADMNREFYYHDAWNTIANGTNYGAVTVAPDAANAISGQPVQDPNNPVRQFTGDSIKTTLVPLNGATTVTPTAHNAGNGSFMARFALPNGGSRFGHDVLWETRVRYVTPRYYWFALWNAGTQWDGGAEFDVTESFGYDNGGGNTNYDGRYWHSDPVGAAGSTNYANWNTGMASHGITTYDATQYHNWSMLYRTNNTFSFYVDGIEVQSGTMNWTLSGTPGGTPIDFHFLFDAGWGHTQVASVNHPLPASELVGKYYEFDWSRIYER
jgi:hypothetical protein